MAMIITVSGARGVLGKDLTVSTGAQLAGSFVNTGPAGGRYVLASDTRPSGRALKLAAGGAILAAGAQAIDLGVVSTPGASLMTRRLAADGAMIITASHNPIEWNGMKFIGPDGMGISAQQAAKLKANFLAQEHLDFPDPLNVGQLSTDDSTHNCHIQAVLDCCDKQLLARLSKRKLKVVLDSVNGAGCIASPQLLEKLGCQVVHINGQPTGMFAHMPEPTAQNLTGLCQAVKDNAADIGFAQDPDADRLAVVDQNGTYIGEEYSLVLAAMFVLSKQPGPVAVNLSTSRMIDDLAGQFDQPVIRTPVGEANVAAAILAQGCPIGGEGNGGVIFPAVVPVRDSFIAMALILQLIADTEQTLSSLVSNLPSYAMIKTKLPIGRISVQQVLDNISAANKDAKQNTADGLRLDWPDTRAWLHIRPSNTEPIIRIIAEAPGRDLTQKLIDKAQQFLDK